ncbi:MAG: 4-hydroxy-tetrahydrodipicolinate synthase [Oscillospiraceae bacterium]|nr:4-hydroxy-tetrahydrodipicolinate synthase [Oscillospiraceae bacterium]
MKKPVFTGSSAAVITPFKNGKIDYDSFKRIIDMQKIAGTSALTVCGTTGEASTLRREERFALVAFAKAFSDNIPVIAGSGSNSTEHAIQFSLDAEKAGADAVLVVTPYYNKAAQKGLIEHYTAVADSVSIPVIVYNVPSRTGVNFKPETYLELSRHPNINGVKEASGDFWLFTRTLGLCGDELNIWSGNDDVIVPMMSLGAKGVISVAANIIPAEIARLVKLCEDGRFPEAAELQIKYEKLISLLFSEVNPIPVKAAMNELGLCGNELRLPLTEISEKNRALLTDELKALKVL